MYLYLDDAWHHLKDGNQQTSCGIDVPAHVIVWESDLPEGETPHCGPGSKKAKEKA